MKRTKLMALLLALTVMLGALPMAAAAAEAEPLYRKDAVVCLWNDAGCPAPTLTENPFADVDADAEYYKAVLWAAETGLTDGTGGGMFSPDAEVSRAQMAAFLWKQAGKPASRASIPFADVAQNAWYAPAVAWALEAGVLDAGADSFSPDAAVSLAELETAVGTSFAGGKGTAEDPWQIATAQQLNHVRNDLSGHYVLVNNIDLSAYENWEPIGAFRALSDASEDAEVPHPDYAFTGTFDGNGYTISNLNVASQAPIGTGLFGCTSGTENGAGAIRNFTLENINVSGGYLVGGAVGLQFMNCPVSDIHLVGDNHLTGVQGVGGIVGTGFDLISDCTATAEITALGDDGACAGLIAGGTTMSSIKNCEVKGGSITAEGNATWAFGALCGAPWGASEITDCKVSGTVITVTGEGNRLVGGLLGFGGSYDPAAPAQITGCTVEDVTILVSETTDSVGGLIGAGKEMMEGSDVMSSFAISSCAVSGSITGGGNYVDAVVGDPACAVSVDCEGGMTVSAASGVFPAVAGAEGTTYVSLFDVIISDQWTPVWVDYVAVIVGEDAAADLTAGLQSAITSDLYGEAAVAAFSGGGYAFDCDFINGAQRITFKDDTVTILKTDGTSETHTYEYLGQYNVGDGETMQYQGMEISMAFPVDVYKSTDEAGEFNYFLLRDDTMEETYHIEFRYGRDLDELQGYLVGPYAYWLAAGIDESADADTIRRVIALFCLENMDYSAHTEAALKQIEALGFVGDWKADLSAFGEAYASVDLRMTIDENGHGETFMDGVQTADFEAYAVDNGAKGDGTGIYVAYSNLEYEAETAPYTMTVNDAGQTVLTLTADDGTISWVKYS